MHPPLNPSKHPLCKEVPSQCQPCFISFISFPVHINMLHQHAANMVVVCFARPLRTSKYPCSFAALVMMMIAGLDFPNTMLNRTITQPQVIAALIKCHEEHPIAKVFGKCNDEKAALNNCFTKEKEIMRTARQKVAKERYREQHEKLKLQQQRREEAAAKAAEQQ